MITEEQRRSVLSAVNEERVLSLIRSMIGIPSQLWQESNMARFLAGYMQSMGMQVEIQEVRPGNGIVTYQAIGRLTGSGQGPKLMLCGHTDTSGWGAERFRPEEWTHNPYAGDVEDGMLYGLGAINMKSGLGAILEAAHAIKDSTVPIKGDLIVACVASETGGGPGAIKLVESGIDADFCVVTEATNLDVATISVGYVKGVVTIGGEYSHHVPYTNAIAKISHVVNAFGASYEPITPNGWLSFEPHPELEGYPRIAIRDVRHHQGVVELEFDLRTVPGMTDESVKRDIERLLRKIAVEDPAFQATVRIPPSPHTPNMPARDETSRDAVIVKSIAKWHEHLCGKTAVLGAGDRKGATADTVHFKEAGIVSIEYGPGEVPVWPMVNERIRIADINVATRVLALTAADILC